MKKGYIKPIQLADKLGVRPQQVFGWVRNGDLDHVLSDAGTKLIKVEDAKAFLSKKAEYYAAKADKFTDLVDSL